MYCSEGEGEDDGSDSVIVISVVIAGVGVSISLPRVLAVKLSERDDVSVALDEGSILLYGELDVVTMMALVSVIEDSNKLVVPTFIDKLVVRGKCIEED